MSIFVDHVNLYLRSGHGGAGCVSFRREKFVPKGGPDGGDGGRGGDVIFEARANMSTLMDLKYKKKYLADNGRPGEGSQMHGKDGKNIMIRVPCGTTIYRADTREVLADLVRDKQRYKVCKGGKGGLGNMHFATSVNQAPRYAQKGLPGEEINVEVELKLLADVGIIGYPNVGKSSLLSCITASKPKIANYPFTTLVPNLGVVSYRGQRNFVVADVPGIIRGAHDGVGLGIQFLRHIERTKLLVHVIDVISFEEDRSPQKDFQVINDELRNYQIDLTALPQIIVLNKIDLVAEEDREKLNDLAAYFRQTGQLVFLVSAGTREGLDPLVGALAEYLDKLDQQEIEANLEEALNA